MWDEAEKQERLYKATYEFAMWTQDDVFWVGPLSLIRLARAYVRYSDTIWSHKCRAFGGINDRTVLMGRQAAAVLMRAYKSFWDPQYAPLGPPLVSHSKTCGVMPIVQCRSFLLFLIQPM